MHSGIAVVLAATMFGCARLVLGPNIEAWLGVDPRPRAIRVELDPSLSPEGAWRVGSNPPPPGTRLDDVEVVRLDGVEVVVERIGSDSIRVEVRATWNDRMYSRIDELWLDFDVNDAPSARAKASTFAVGTPSVWRTYGLRGVVRVSSTSLVPPNEGSSTFVLAYEIEGSLSGSDVASLGKVAIDLNQLR